MRFLPQTVFALILCGSSAFSPNTPLSQIANSRYTSTVDTKLHVLSLDSNACKCTI